MRMREIRPRHADLKGLRNAWLGVGIGIGIEKDVLRDPGFGPSEGVRAFP